MKYTITLLVLLCASTVCADERSVERAAIKKERKALSVQLRNERAYERFKQAEMNAFEYSIFVSPLYYTQAQKRQAARNYPWSRLDGMLYHERVMSERSIK